MAGLLDSLDAPVLAISTSLTIAHVNDAAEAWLGRSRQRLAGRSLHSLEPHGAALAAVAAGVLASPGTATAELGEEAAIRSVNASAWWVGGRLAGVVLLISTPRAVPAGDARADLETLASGLAHEVRNPLAAIRGAGELLAGELAGAPADVRDYVTLILRETRRVDSLFARMLDLGRPPVLARGAVRVGELIHDLALQALALAKARHSRVEVEERFDPALPIVFLDRERIFEALVNLAKNAVEAAPAGSGHLVLEARIEADLRRRDASGRATPLLRLSVRDDGPGLHGVQARVFTPFFTTKAGGTGLGLLLARRAIEAHGGVLLLRDVPPSSEGEPGRGAEAVVLLPLERRDG